MSREDHVEGACLLLVSFTCLSMIIGAIPETGFAKKPRAAQPCELLENDRCSSCNESFGPWMILPTMKRACFQCIKIQKDFGLVKPKTAKSVYDLTDADLEKIGYFATVPERWRRDAWSDRDRGKLHKLISFALAGDYAPRKYNTTLKALHKRLQSTKPHHDISKRQRLIALTYLNKDATEAHETAFMNPHSLLDDFRGIACFPFPRWTRDRGTEDALYCFGCTLDCHTGGSASFDCGTEELSDDWFITRNREEFLEHVDNAPSRGKSDSGLRMARSGRIPTDTVSRAGKTSFSSSRTIICLGSFREWTMRRRG